MVKAINIEVRRGSQRQNTPHIGFAHIGPEIRTISENTTPSSAAANARQSQFSRRVRKY